MLAAEHMQASLVAVTAGDDSTYKVWMLKTAIGITLCRYRAYLHSDGSLARSSLAKEYICSFCNNSLLLVGIQKAGWTAP